MHGLVFAALLVAVPAPPMPAPPMPGAPVAEGARIRFTGVAAASGPGAPRPGSSSIPGVVLWADDRFTVRGPDGEVWTLPRPGQELQGRLVGVREGQIDVVLEGRHEVAHVPLTAVQGVQVARSGRDHLRGARNGAVAGGLFGLGFAVYATLEVCGALKCDNVTRDTMIFTGAGAALGALVGGAIGTRRWEPLEPGRMALTLGPRADGVGFSLRIGLPRR